MLNWTSSGGFGRVHLGGTHYSASLRTYDTSEVLWGDDLRSLTRALIAAGYGPGNADEAALNADWKRPTGTWLDGLCAWCGRKFRESAKTPLLHHWLGAEGESL